MAWRILLGAFGSNSGVCEDERTPKEVSNA